MGTGERELRTGERGKGGHGKVKIFFVSLQNEAPKVRSQKKKRHYLGIFPKRRPPPTPPFWEPLIQKKILVFILHFRT